VATNEWIGRLRDLLGALPDEASREQVHSLIAHAKEDADLDFKATLYGTGDSEKRDLAGDVAAMANDRGGLIVLGVAENDGVASSEPEVDLSEEEEQRMRHITAALVAPHVEYRVRRIEGTSATRGFYLLIVPPSPLRPHAVRVNNALRYPRRDGPTTRYLSELEVADMYRDRFRDERQQLDRLDRIVAQAQGELDDPTRVWLAAALVPNSPGSVEINAPTRLAIERWARSGDLVDGFVGENLFGSAVAGVGVRRYRIATVYDEPGTLSSPFAHCHTDGSAVMMFRFPELAEPSAGRTVAGHTLLKASVAMLRLIGRHAVQNAGVAGDAVVELRLLGPQIHLGAFVLSAVERIREARPVTGTSSSRHTVPLAQLTGDAQPLLAATALMLSDIYNAFGLAEVSFLTPAGAMRSVYFSGQTRQWAEEHGVELTDEPDTQ
jgi:hypothetical protein